MTTYEFALKLNREVTDDEIEDLYEAGCDDAAIETGPLGGRADFSREAASLVQALVTAIRDIEKVPGLRATGVECDNMVTLLDIAERAGVTREAARLWASGQRGSRDFPHPVFVTTGGEKVWDWEQVSPWIDRHMRRDSWVVHSWSDMETVTTIRILCTADRVLAARDALRSEPDESVRQEFGRLLEDA